MPQMLIVSWTDSNSGTDASSAGSVKWHFVKDESGDKTLCDFSLPAPKSRKYAEIRTEEMVNIKGFCFTCFHNVCIDEQDEDLWQIFNRVEELNSCLNEIGSAIKDSKCSPEEINSALALYEQLVSHTVIKSLTGD
ncbi:hypothetical protein [Massilia sp. Root335]|uniref:hypothetical protein n=1 Tax=Massilia sp. Root335 TaxID=1736517 RepID=UPI0012F6A0D0|nr:hypothetical protein [Massilia sp. Root335]